ncbi:MAG: nicotinate-nucleotide adenylyltransferase [Clostridiales Family XIII bacterium]|jgi:nicotinate-nucleotide adenylyltransferase|nr:nicotinate-nucleotide adenylyltransferase [Clostridiales Family XIII bacterium]
MRTGVFGGSFDPVHNAHLAIAERAICAVELDMLLFMPVHSQPFKLSANMSGSAHRMDMLHLAIRGGERFGVTDVELARGGVSYTIDSLRAIRGDGAKTGEIFFLLGADMLLMLEKWYRADELLREFSFIAARRPGSGEDDFELCAERLRESYGARVILMDNPKTDISSSEIRARVRAGESIEGLVPASVGKYIYENGLYCKP